MSEIRMPPVEEWARAVGGADVPSSTYRIQLGASCRFADVEVLVPYLASLGVGAVYLSPVLRARSGSTHGYDTVDFGQLSPEFGGGPAFEVMARTIRDRGLGLVLDVVPNHMSVDPMENLAWRDVLENGPSARHAEWFDIDWEPANPSLAQKVLLPILGDQYGLVLERGEIRLIRSDALFEVAYGNYRLPFNPELVPLIFEGALGSLHDLPVDRRAIDEFVDILAAFGRLPPYTVRYAAAREARRRDAAAAADRLTRLLGGTPGLAAFVHDIIERINGTPGQSETFDQLHTLLEHQAYRLAYWRTAFDEINYRRFFDVNELAAVRMEDPRVFEAAHGLVLDLVGRGLVTGVRIDHPDGLADPEAYFDQLQEAAWLSRARVTLQSDADAAAGVDAQLTALAAWRREQRGRDPQHWAVRPLYMVAEKIVTASEVLPAGWAIHGGTGYRFLNQINGLFLERSGLHRIERAWARRVGRTDTFDEIAYECRRLIASTAMASEMNMVAHALEEIAGATRGTRDFTLNSLRQVLREVVASFPVYRTYVSDRGISDADRRAVTAAVAEARRRSPVMDQTIFAFVEQVLLPDVRAGAGPAWLRFAMRFQQLTSPIQAKGVEDTAFYRYTPLLALNEVGSHPAAPTRSVDDFHSASQARRAIDPGTMTTLATHDTKRSGDARARLAALTEHAAEWTRAVALWSTINVRHRTGPHGECWPDADDEYQLYQALLAIWPPEADGTPIPSALPDMLVERLEAYMVKAVREAKRRSNWLRPDLVYEQGLRDFARAITRGAGATRFLTHFAPFARSVAKQGAASSLAQMLVWLGSPGVPDVYQGSETWHLHLVDPDNRGPVEFASHGTRLAELDPWLNRAAARVADDEVTALVSRLVAHWHDGTIKTWCLATGLRHRRQDPLLFGAGDYVPLVPEPPDTRVVALARVYDGRALIVAVPRLAGRLTRDGSWPLGGVWSGAHLIIPDVLAGQLWRDRLSSRVLETVPSVSGRTLPLDALFSVMPGVWLEAIDGGS